MVRSFSSREGPGRYEKSVLPGRKRNEGLEAGRAARGDALVLQLAQAHHVVDLLGRRLEVTEQQRGVGGQAQGVRVAVHLEPLLGRQLAVGDDLAHPRAEHLCPAARHGVVPRGDETLEGLARRDPGHPGHELDLHGREGRERHVRQRGLELAEEVLVVLEGVLLGHSSHDVQLGDAEVGDLLRAVHQLVHRVRVGAGVVVGPHGEGAEAAAHHADVGGVQVRVDVVRDLVAVHSARDRLGGGAEVLERGLLVQREGVVCGDALAVGGAGQDGVDHGSKS